VLAKAIRWGAGRSNVVRTLERLPKNTRRRYVTDAEFSACQALAKPQLAIAMDLARLTGQRLGDLLRLRREQITDDGIVVRQGKTGAGVLIEMTPALQEAIDAAFRLRRRSRATT
jgi:integrase